MSEYTVTQSNFAGGVVDEVSQGSRTSQAYLAGLAEAENVFFWPTGAVYRRQGTRHTGLAFQSSGKLRTVSFLSGSDRFMAVFTAGTLYIYSSALDLKQTILTDYVESDLDSLSAKACQGALYIVHKNHPPRILHSETDGGVWPSVADTGETADIEVDESLETVDISKVVAMTDWTLDDIVFTGTDFSKEGRWPRVQAFKGGRWIIGSTESSPDSIWASRPYDDDGSSRFTDFTIGDKYLSTLTTTTVRKVTTTSSGETTTSEVTSSNTVEAPWEDGDSEGEYDKEKVVEQQEDADGNPVEVTTTAHVRNTATWKVLDNHAVELVESDMTGGDMRWIAVAGRLLVCYGRSIWMDGGTAITPASFDLTKTLSLGSPDVEPVAYGSLIFMVGLGGKNILALGWDSDSGGYTVSEVSSQARSLLSSGIRKLAIAESDITVLFALLADGTLAACTISGGLFGWSRITFGEGLVKGMDIFEGDDGDELYLVVKRGTIAQLERLPLRGPDDDEAVYLDDRTTYESASEKSAWTVNDDAYEEEVQLVADGVYAGSVELPEDGSVTLEAACKRLDVGYGYASEVRTLDPELPANGSSLGKRRQVMQAVATVYRSLDFKAGTGKTAGSLVTLPVMATRKQVEWLASHMKEGSGLSDVRRMLYGASTYGNADQPYSGRRELPVTGDTSGDGGMTMRVEAPVPWCLVALTAKYSIREA